MAEAGVLVEDERVELITGEIVGMTPIGSQHAGCVRGLNRQLTRALGDRALIAVQDPIVLDDTSEPEPDIAVLRFREDDYRSLHPKPADVLLIIEVADTSVDYDRNVKLPLYAQAGIPEAWLVRLREACIEIHRNPAATGYQEMRTLRSGDRVSPLAFPDLELAVAAVLG
jgi:Uma2 family endonuclease